MNVWFARLIRLLRPVLRTGTSCAALVGRLTLIDRLKTTNRSVNIKGAYSPIQSQPLKQGPVLRNPWRSAAKNDDYST